MGRLKSAPSRLGALATKLPRPAKQADGFYLSAEWRLLVADLKKIRGGCCERCGSDNRVVGDHIVELKDGGAPLDPSNVEFLCARHHSRKTAEARRRRALGEAAG